MISSHLGRLSSSPLLDCSPLISWGPLSFLMVSTDFCLVFVCCSDALLVSCSRVGSVFVSFLYPSYHLEQYFSWCKYLFLSVFVKWKNKETLLPFIGTYGGFLLPGVPNPDTFHYRWGSWIIWSHSCYHLPLPTGWLGLFGIPIHIIFSAYGKYLEPWRSSFHSLSWNFLFLLFSICHLTFNDFDFIFSVSFLHTILVTCSLTPRTIANIYESYRSVNFGEWMNQCGTLLSLGKKKKPSKT